MKIERILNQFRDVSCGLFRKVIPNKRYSLLYSLRMYECNHCHNKTKKIGIDSCSICGCFLPLKIRSVTKTNNCPMDKWIDSKYFGRFKYANSIVNKGNDSIIARKEVRDIFFYLRDELKKLCTRAQFRRAYRLAMTTNKAAFELGLINFMEESLIISKSKFRDKNQFRLEVIIRELNTACKSIYILDIFNDNKNLNVKKNR